MKIRKVMVPGRFVVIHPGHMRLFQAAKELGDYTVVALNTEGLTNYEIDWRTKLLNAISGVEEVVTFGSNIENLLLQIKPEFLLKGSEFAKVNNPEEAILNKYGGKLVFSPGAYYSTESTNFEIEIKSIKFDVFENSGEYISRNGIVQEKLLRILDDVSKVRTCVIGDLIVDEIINCHPIGMSQEEPTIVAKPIDSTRFIGGAGIVAAHAEALGSTTTFITVVGEDSIADWSKNELLKSVSALVALKDSNRPTTLKQKFKSGKQILLKLTHAKNDFIPNDLELAILEYFSKNAANFDLLILSDFSFGIFTDYLAFELIKIAKNNSIFIAADSQFSSQIGNLEKFKGADLVTPTEFEARSELKDEMNGLVVLADKLRMKMDAKFILLKLGADGLLLNGVDNRGNAIRTDRLPALNNNPVDVSGAGDSLLASSALVLASRESIYYASLIGSIAAGIQISRLGNIPIDVKTFRGLISQ